MLSRVCAVTSPIWIACTLALLPACETTSHVERTSPSAAKGPADADHELAASRDKLSLAKMQLEIARKKGEDAKMHKERDLEFARDELSQFDSVDAPNRIAKARLELARHTDALFEQEEELAQLDMMYEKENLADKTREIVLQRGKRRVDRAKEELAITERDTKALETLTIPRERSKLALEVEVKTRELASMATETDATMLERRMAVEVAEVELLAAEMKAGSRT